MPAQAQWRVVRPPDDAIVVNLGDLAARWANDRLLSTRHRVYNGTDRTRYSFAFFCNADFDAKVACVCADGAAPKYPPVRAGEYLMQRLGIMYQGDQACEGETGPTSR